MAEPVPDPGAAAARLAAPLARLLRPLVRLMIQSGVGFPVLAELLRELYVNVAEREFALADKKQTDSRVSLLTGIHRKEVSRLRGAGAPVNLVPAAVSRVSHIISVWLSAPEYTDAEGRPRPLPRAANGRPSFESLVASVTRDVRSRAVLDEWRDRGVVTLDADDCVRLLETAFTPPSGSDEQLYYFGRNLADHMAAATANVIGASPRFLERAVHYDGLSAELAEALVVSSRELALNALQGANREASRALPLDSGGDHRWIFGVYVYKEKVEPAPTPRAQESPA